MIGGVTHHILPHLPGVPHLHVNRPLRIEIGRHCVPNINSQKRWNMSTLFIYNDIENEMHFIFNCSLHSLTRENFYDDITIKYPNFTNLCYR